MLAGRGRARYNAYDCMKNLFPWRRKSEVPAAADYAALAAGLAVFAGLTLATITQSSIWFDEAFSAYIIQFDFAEIARYTATDVHPPLYYWLLKLWSMLFGTGELALRSMSMFFAGVAITFGFLLARRYFGRQAAWLSLLFMALAPMLVRYGQEMRMYTLAAAIAMAATYVLARATEGKNRKLWVTYGVLVGLGMLTHYFTALVWIAHWVWRASVTKGSLKARIRQMLTKQWLWAHGVAIGLFALWLPFLARQLVDVQVNGFWIPPVTPTTIPNFLTNVLFYQEQTMVTGWLALAFLGIVGLLVWLAVRVYGGLNGMQRRVYGLVAAVAFVPMIVLFLASMPPLRPAFVDRYLVSIVAAVSLFTGVTLALSTKYMRKRYLQVGVAVVVAGAMALGIANVYALGNYNKNTQSYNGTRQALQLVAARGDNQPIIADSPGLFYEAVFYESPAHPVYFIDANTQYRYGALDMLKYNDMHKIKDLTAFTRQHPLVWYFGRPGDGTLSAPVPSWQPLQEVQTIDPTTGKPLYRAIQYRAQ